MKTIYLIFGFLISVMMISCDLDRIPEDTMSPETFFSS